MVIHHESAVLEEAESSALLPRQVVLYCGKCGMPPEYCEYGPDFETHCSPWLKKNHPEAHTILYKGKEGSSSKPPKPSEPWTIEQRLTAFYETYVPEKIESIPGLLEKYAGNEENLFTALVKKYGPEPEDPFDADSDDSEDDEDDDDDIATPINGRKRRGAKAKASEISAIRIVIQKQTQKRKKFMTIVHGMETVPNIKLKDVSKTFSKKFAGSSSVKDKSIIVQGDHVYEAAELIVDQFEVPAECVFLDIDGDVHPLK